MATVATTHFADRLAEAVEHKRSQLVVGLDPRPDLLPVELKGEAHLGRAESADACARFCRGLVDAVAPYVVGVKPQVAFFEALGADGVRALEDVCAYARAAGLQVIADAKRGDIGSTARAYATAFLERTNGRDPLADAVTVNPYLGRDSIDPFLAACRREGAGLFCVIKTSNSGSAEVQDLVRRAGSDAGGRRARVHEWARERTRERGAQRHLRLPGVRDGLAQRGRGGSLEVRARGVVRLRLVITDLWIQDGAAS